MWPYWFLFLLIVWAALSHRPAFPGGPSPALPGTRNPPGRQAPRHGPSRRQPAAGRDLRLTASRRTLRVHPQRPVRLRPPGPAVRWPASLRPDNHLWLLSGLGVVVALMVGLRHEVGGDWYNYLMNFEYLRTMQLELAEVLRQPDPGYELLNWLAIRLELDICAVNLFCGVVFSAGLVAFARRQPDPLLALVVAVPYLVVVVAMGYTRQAVAIGLALLALNALRDNAMLRFILWIAAAGTFHGTAVVLILVGLVANMQNWRYSLMLGLPAAWFLYNTLLEDRVERFADAYLEAGMDSEGAFIRVLMCALPAMIFLVWRRRFRLQGIEYRLWVILALLSILALAAFFVLPSSTVVDRLALYLIPIQLFVLSRLPAVLAPNAAWYRTWSLGIVAYSAAVLFVWLNYAGHAYAWVPYGFYPLAAHTP
jgi:hypothetical protein